MTLPTRGRGPGAPRALLHRRALGALALAAVLTASSPTVAPQALAEIPGEGGSSSTAAVAAGTVVIDGTAAVGRTVTATPSGWTPAETTYGYQWAVDGVDVPDADEETLLVDAAWVGGSLTVTVTGTAPDATTDTSTSAPVTVAAGQFAAPPVPTLTGAARVGGTLTAVAGSWSPPATLGYQWRRNGGAIAGAVGRTYVPVVADKGATVSVVVTGSAPGYTSRTSTPSAGVVVGAGAFTSAPVPKVQGAAVVGTTLKAVPGTWSPAATLTYRWLRNGALIPGATTAAYRLTATDHADRIAVRVSGTRSGFTTVVRTSAATAVVAKPFARTTVPAISGAARVGSTLTAGVAAWSPTARSSFQWRRGGTPIPGATARTYRLAPADHQRHITVTVTGRRAAYVTASRTSPATARVAAPRPALSRDGSFRVGTEIAAGTYVSRASDFCYWSRRKHAGSDLAGIIANDLGSGQRIVRIVATDRYFTTDGCGAWTRLVPLAVPRTKVADGVFAVGAHLRPGLYKTAGGPFCYWARLSGFSAELRHILENEIGPGQHYVRINATDVGFESSDCGTWTRVGN